MSAANEDAPAQPAAPQAEPTSDVMKSAQDQFLDVVEKAVVEIPQDPYMKNAYFIFTVDTFPRKQCIALMENPWFDRFILSLIVLNCFTMILFDDPILKSMFGNTMAETSKALSLSTNAQTSYVSVVLMPFNNDCVVGKLPPCSVVDIIDILFLVFFTIEMAVKIVALGFISYKTAYMRSAWNVLDAVVVITGWISLLASEGADISVLRTFKVLRPLRSMNKVRGLRVLVQSILSAVPQLCNVVGFLCFYLIVFGIIGVSLFQGTMRHRCYHETEPGVWEDTGWVCAPGCTIDSASTRAVPGSCTSLGNKTLGLNYLPPLGGYTCQKGEQCVCGEGGVDDSIDQENCQLTDNPNYGANNFDNIFWAMFTIFQSITLEGWVDIMYQVMDGYNLIFWIYFVVAVLLGAYILINLFLAVLCDNFNLADSEGDPEEKVDGEALVAEAANKINHKNAFRKICLKITLNNNFNNLVAIVICINTVIMGMAYTPYLPERSYYDFDYLPPWQWMFFFVMNVILSLFFVFESFVKVVGLGWHIFKMDGFNLFDLTVVVFSMLELVLDFLRLSNAVAARLPGVSALRAFRLLRLLKLVRFVESLRVILRTLINSIKSVVYLGLLLILFILIFALIGMQTFGGMFPRPEYDYTPEKFPLVFESRGITWDYDGDGEAPPLNFDSIGDGILTIFVVLSGENWNDVCFNMHRAVWASQGPVAILYFFILFIVGNLLLFNLFIAILLSNFDDDEEEAEDDDDDDLLDDDDDLVTNAEGAVRGKKAGKDEEPSLMGYTFGSYRLTEDINKRKSGAPMKRAETPSAALPLEGEGSVEEEEEKPAPVSKIPPKDDNSGDRSLMIFSWSNPIRRGFAHVVYWRFFDSTIIFLIIASSFCLALDWPGYDYSNPVGQTLKAFDVIFTIIFTIECFMKIVVMGLIKGPDTYLHFGWNILDGIIVLISLITQIGGSNPAVSRLSFLRALRALRALRPLRLISRFESLKQVVDTLIKSVPAIGSLITVAMLFFCIFGILGMTLFGGRFGTCVDPGDASLPGSGDGITPGYQNMPDGTIMSDYDECMAKPKYNLTRHNSEGILLSELGPEYEMYYRFPQWIEPNFGNFNNIGTSILLLFEVAALEGWPDVMATAMAADAEEPFVEPSPLYGHQTDDMQVHYPMPHTGAIFFVLWIILGCFVVMNMTIGVVVDTFAKIREENNGCALMTDEQSEWVQAQKRVIAMRPRTEAVPPAAQWRITFFDLVQSNKFDMAIMGVILLNLVHMACGIYDPSWDSLADFNKTLEDINFVFFAIYLIEMILKLIGLGVGQYFRDTWNDFDFFLVCLQVIDIVMMSLDNSLPFPPTLPRVLRLFRVVRILRILKTAKSIRTIIVTIYVSLPSLVNIMLLIALMLFIFSVLAVNLFFRVNYTPGNWPTGMINRANWYYFPDDFHYDGFGTNYGDFIHRHANFEGLGRSILTLWRCATGESFNGLMHDAMGAEWGDNRLRCCPTCGPLIEVDAGVYVPEGSCGDTFWSLLLFLLFYVLMAYIVLSLAIGVILENFANVGSENKAITMEQLEEFREVWLKYDPRGTFIVPSHNLLAILQQLHYPLGIHGKVPAFSRAQMLQFMGKLDIPDHGGYIHFLETLTAICNNVCGVPVPVCETTRKIQKSVLRAPQLTKLERPAHNALTNYLVSLLQSRWRGYAMRKRYSDHPQPGGGDAAADGAGGEGKVKPNQVAPAP